MTDVEHLKQILIDGRHSLVVENQHVSTFDGRGIKDLRRLIATQPELLCGSRVADKVVGKGAAALLVKGRVSEVFACTASRPALALLRENGITASCDNEVDAIANVSHTGLCPIEQLCLPCATTEECLRRIDEFFANPLKTS